MPTGSAYQRAMLAPSNPFLREAIQGSRADLDIPEAGFQSVEDARNWYLENGGNTSEGIGNSPPGPVPDLRPMTDQLKALGRISFAESAQIDAVAVGITRRFDLPASMLGWVREEILRDTSSVATLPDGATDYAQWFRRWSEEVRNAIICNRAHGEELGDFYFHASPIHASLCLTHEDPPQYGIVITGLDASTTNEEWDTLTDLLWSTLGNLVERPLGRRGRLNILRRNLRLWQLRKEGLSYKKIADRYEEDEPDDGETLNGRAVQRAVDEVEQLMLPIDSVQLGDVGVSKKKLVKGVVKGPRSYEQGGFSIVIPEAEC